MICAVRCNKPSFKTVTFRPGMNVVLADRTKESTKKDSRNGLGKSTLIEILHYCLGGTASPERLGSKPLVGWTFTLDVDLGGGRISVSRSTDSPSKVAIEGDTSAWPVQPVRSRKTGLRELNVKKWNEILGHLAFGLGFPSEPGPYRPRFRNLISYFMRLGPDAYVTPFEHHRKQLVWAVQVFNAFLLGLDWQYAREWQELKDREKTLKSLQKAAREGLLDDALTTVGDLEATRVRLEEDLTRQAADLSSFRVHAQYERIETEVNSLTARIHALQNQNVMDRRFLQSYEDSLADEIAPSSEALLRLYEEAGVVMPGAVKRRLDEVTNFHTSLIANRRQFLQAELEEIARRMNERRASIAAMSDRRASLMQILKTHGALAEYTLLQERYARTAGQLEDVRRRIGQLRDFEHKRSDLAIQRQQLFQRARADLEERQAQRSKAISTFNAYSRDLYAAHGRLVIDVDETGYRYDVDIERSGSQGIDKMKVFCYDLMLAKLWAGRDPSPGFLVHDSTIFDGVDERQIALGLELAERETRSHGFQYICALNSDTVPWSEFSEGFDLDSFVRVKLTDATDDGSLLGIRF